MNVPAGLAVVFCLCPLGVFLCLISKGCYGIQINTNSVPSWYPNRRLLSEPTTIPSQSLDKQTIHLLPSQHLNSSQNIGNKFQSLESVFHPVENHMANKPRGPSATHQEISRSTKDSSSLRQVLSYKLSAPQETKISLNNDDTPEPRQGSQLKPKTSSEELPESEKSSESKYNPDEKHNTFVNMNPGQQHYPAPLTKPNPHAKLHFTSKTNVNTKPDQANLSRTSTREERGSQQRPKRGWIRNQFFVLEEQIGPEPQYVGKLQSNSDKGDGSVRYILSGEGAGSVFIIDETTGDLHAAKRLDREKKSQYVLRARVIERRTNRSLEAESEFIIKVQDVNDNAPTFPGGPYSASVPEMCDVGTSAFHITASDADDPSYGNSAKILYSILEGEPYFSVDAKTGVIRTAVSNLDRETKDHYAVVIQAKDMAGSVGGLSGSTTVNINITDVNDNPPKFTQKSYQLYVPELAAVGKTVGRIRASDEDEGQNAEMTYSITNADAAAIFAITTDDDGREGIISLKQPLNYEKKKVHTLNIEGYNTHIDSRFFHLGPFKDFTSLRVIVGDVDEPPVFSMDYYIMDVYENSPVGTQVGTVTAMDPDSTNSPLRYFLNNEDRPLYFTIGVNSGIVRTTKVLDREEKSWHNITVTAAEVDNPHMVSHVIVTIQVLDVNDNIPFIYGGNSAVTVCSSTKNGQVVQTIRAADLDNFANGKFSFYVPTENQFNSSFMVKDNGDSTASIISRRPEGFGQYRDQFFNLVMVVADGGEPSLSSTTTLFLRVCDCQKNPRGRSSNTCQSQAFLSSAGLSTGAFVAIMLCILILLAIVLLFTLLRNKKTQKETLILSEEDIRENVVTYDDEGGGEADTEAFDIAALRNPKASQPRWQHHTYLDHGANVHEEEEEGVEVELNDEGFVVMRRRKKPDHVEYGNYSPESEPAWFIINCTPQEISQSAPSHLLEDLDVIQQILQHKVSEVDSDTRGPPYDSLQTYAYEGLGSLAGSISSLGLNSAVPEFNCADLDDWMPDIQLLDETAAD